MGETLIENKKMFRSKVRVGKNGKTIRNFNFTKQEPHHHYLIDNLESIGKGLSVGGTLNRGKAPIIQLPPHAFEALVKYNRLKRFVGDSFIIEVPMAINGRNETIKFQLTKQEVYSPPVLVAKEESVDKSTARSGKEDLQKILGS